MNKNTCKSLAEWQEHYLPDSNSENEKPVDSIEDAKALGRHYGNANIESLIASRQNLAQICHKAN